MPDESKPYWSVAEVAEYLEVKPKTVYEYRTNVDRAFPKEDETFGRSPVWKPATITGWKRAGRGKRTDLGGEAVTNPFEYVATHVLTPILDPIWQRIRNHDV